MTDELKALLKRCRFGKDAEEVEEILIVPSSQMINELSDKTLQHLDEIGIHIPYKKFTGMTLIGINHRPKEEAVILGNPETMEDIKFRGGRTLHIDVPTCYGFPRVISEYPFIVQTYFRDVLVKVRGI